MKITGLIMFLAGVVVGVPMTMIAYKLLNHAGTLRIDSSDPDKEVYRFDVDNLDILSKKKVVWLKVDKNADLSQK